MRVKMNLVEAQFAPKSYSVGNISIEASAHNNQQLLILH